MAYLIDKVRAITRSTTTQTSDDKLVYYLNMGSKYTVMSIPRQLLWYLAEDGSNITDGNGYAVNKDIIFEVRRNGMVADQVDANKSYQVGLVGSLYEATSMFPKYYIRTGKVYIKPDPNTVEVGVVTTVSPPTITATTDSDSISYSQIENIIILYSSALDFTGLANYYSQQATDNISSSGDARDALDKAKELIDTSSGINAEYWLGEEDSEMAQVTVQTAYQEVQRAIAEMESGKEYSQEAQVYFQKADEYFKLAQNELQNYVNSNPEMMAMQAQMQAQQGGKR